VATILIIEDESDLASLLRWNLEKAGHAVELAETGAAGLARAKELEPTLVLLDLMLPDVSGLDVLRALRAEPRLRDTLVVMVTARGEEEDRVRGFEVGADDYVVKPFSVRELVLRVGALLRRNEDGPAFKPPLVFGELVVDSVAHRVTWRGQEIAITALEFKLLEFLLEREGRVQSREVLLQDVWELKVGVVTRTVDTHVQRLRDKLGEAGDVIETVRGVGYRAKRRSPG
jgi:two-component system phosphate regulon response regulator PhoB